HEMGAWVLGMDAVRSDVLRPARQETRIGGLPLGRQEGGRTERARQQKEPRHPAIVARPDAAVTSSKCTAGDDGARGATGRAGEHRPSPDEAAAGAASAATEATRARENCGPGSAPSARP